jgi:nucleoside-diphosphate-sugar epimerase
MALASKKVLITGIDSFTGKHLSSYLKDSGYEVYGTSMIDSAKDIYRCDITKKDDIKALFEMIIPNFIIHLAGISFTAHSDSEAFYKVNTIGTINILETMIDLGLDPDKIILASSATIYGNQGLEILDETLCPLPTNHYGASKYAMECLARNYFDKLNIIITRPFNYVGIGQAKHFLIPKIVEHFKDKKESIELGNLDVTREFNDIGFVCEVYKRLLVVDDSSKILNICSSRGVKLLDIIDDMNNISGYDIKVEVNPEFVRKDEIKTLIGSHKELFDLIGEVPQVDLKETLKKLYEA